MEQVKNTRGEGGKWSRGEFFLFPLKEILNTPLDLYDALIINYYADFYTQNILNIMRKYQLPPDCQSGRGLHAAFYTMHKRPCEILTVILRLTGFYLSIL